MVEFKEFLKEVEKKLSRLVPQVPKGLSAAYIGGGQSKLNYIGLKVPQIDGAHSVGFSFNGNKQLEKVWDFIWKSSTTYEVMSLALRYFNDKNKRDQLVKYWPMLKTWVERIDNWAHADELCSLFAHILERDNRLVLPTLTKWSESDNPWLRRISIVSLIYYANSRKKFLPFEIVLAFVKKQLDHENYYVQKGVGWTLRELYNAYPEKTLKFLKENCTKLSSQAFSAASEKLPESVKNVFKEKRKASRKGKATAVKTSKASKVVKAAKKAARQSDKKSSGSALKKPRVTKPKKKVTKKTT